MVDSEELNEAEQQVYEWQILVPGFGDSGQRKLKGSTVLVSRCGGLGGVVAYELAAAGIGRLILAHAGNIKPSDLNRQLLMTHDGLGHSRVESASKRLRELNPRLEVITVDRNIDEDNAEQWIQQADIVVDAAPLFEERFAMNRAAQCLNKPMVECAMYELEAQITTLQPGITGCLQCMVPTLPENWKRKFPVFGAVSGTVGCLAAMEVIKTLTGLGEPLYNRLLTLDLRDMSTRRLEWQKDPSCPVCGDS